MQAKISLKQSFLMAAAVGLAVIVASVYYTSSKGSNTTVRIELVSPVKGVKNTETTRTKTPEVVQNTNSLSQLSAASPVNSTKVQLGINLSKLQKMVTNTQVANNSNINIIANDANVDQTPQQIDKLISRLDNNLSNLGFKQPKSLPVVSNAEQRQALLKQQQKAQQLQEKIEQLQNTLSSNE